MISTKPTHVFPHSIINHKKIRDMNIAASTTPPHQKNSSDISLILTHHTEKLSPYCWENTTPINASKNPTWTLHPIYMEHNTLWDARHVLQNLNLLIWCHTCTMDVKKIQPTPHKHAKNSFAPIPKKHQDKILLLGYYTIWYLDPWL